jgi:transposase
MGNYDREQIDVIISINPTIRHIKEDISQHHRILYNTDHVIIDELKELKKQHKLELDDLKLRICVLEQKNETKTK